LSEDGRVLYVADTENHALRAVDLDKKRVTTLAGTGEQSRERDPDGPGTETRLNSPWALARVGDQLYMAMAGPHQIWVYDLTQGRVRNYAGTGRELRIDGPRDSAAFAQPSGLATDGKKLYIADSEISTIRVIDLQNGVVSTLAGSGGLFDFGRRDGKGEEARFQHPLGVSLWQGSLYVADAFKHLIRRIDVKTGEVETWLGTGTPEPGSANRPGLYEPGGLSAAAGVLYVADTNHHRILAINIASQSARVLKIELPER
jgi:DNA-binding beta-propeller fold protein YncE